MAKKDTRGKGKRTIRQNRPSWRKVRGWGKKLARKRNGIVVRHKQGRLKGKPVFRDIKIKTKGWIKV